MYSRASNEPVATCLSKGGSRSGKHYDKAEKVRANHNEPSGTICETRVLERRGVRNLIGYRATTLAFEGVNFERGRARPFVEQRPRKANYERLREVKR